MTQSKEQKIMLTTLKELFDMVADNADHLAIAVHPDKINSLLDRALVVIEDAEAHVPGHEPQVSQYLDSGE